MVSVTSSPRAGTAKPLVTRPERRSVSAAEAAPAIVKAGATAQMGWLADLVMVLCGLWLTGGAFLDGWAHRNLPILESFFTPWHAALYSGYGVCATWILWQIVRNHRAGYSGLSALPRGYRLGLAGVFVFAAGGLGDMLWHLRFGIEKNLDALLSPTHLLLFFGVALILTSPLRSQWARTEVQAPSFIQFLPALLSMAIVLSFASFMTMYLWGTAQDFPVLKARYFAQFYSARRDVVYATQQAGLSGMIVTNVMLLAPVLFLLRRWRLPFGSITFLYTFVGVLMSGLLAFRHIPTVVFPGTIAGLAADVLLLVLRPTYSRPLPLRLFAVSVPVVLWGSYFAAEALTRGLGWSTELWSGLVVWNALAGLGLSLMMAPPAWSPVPVAPAPEAVGSSIG